MTALGDYERYLDELDDRMYVIDGHIFCGFDDPFSIQREECGNADALVKITRMVSLRLIQQKGLNVDYLGKRFMRLANSALDLRLDVDRIYEERGIPFIEVDDVILKQDERKHGDAYFLRFENGSGQYAGRSYLELRRNVDRDSDEPVGPLTVSRNMIGYPGYGQHTLATAIDIVHSPTLLVVSLSPGCVWQFDYRGPTLPGSSLTAKRIALRHEVDVLKFAGIENRLSDMLSGLDFTFMNVEDLGRLACRNEGLVD